MPANFSPEGGVPQPMRIVTKQAANIVLRIHMYIPLDISTLVKINPILFFQTTPRPPIGSQNCNPVKGIFAKLMPIEKQQSALQSFKARHEPDLY